MNTTITKNQIIAAMINIWGNSFINLKNIGLISNLGKKKLPIQGASKLYYFPTTPFGFGTWLGHSPGGGGGGAGNGLPNGLFYS